LLISSSHAFLFVAVPKTATSSVEDALAPYRDSQRELTLGKHALAMEFVELFSPEALDALFKFGFVRNPYTWMYSWYRYRQRRHLANPGHRHHDRYAGGKSFDEFMQSYNEGQIFMKQSDFLYSHNDELLVDFVGRYENIQADFDHISQRLALPEIPLEQVNVSSGASFSPEQISPQSRAIINSDFQRDFELFDYPMIR
jgi:hypothetical protein